MIEMPQGAWRFDLLGIPEMQRRLREVEAEVLQAMGRAAYQTAEEVMAESKRQTPVDTGRLRATGYVTLPQAGEVVSTTISYPDKQQYTEADQTEVLSVQARGPQTRISVELGYGTDYAVWVHEIPMRHDGVGEKDHYLSDPLEAASRDFQDALASEVGRVFRRRGRA